MNQNFNLSNYIAEVIKEKGHTKTWVAEKSDINYKTFVDKLTRDTITGKELLRIARVLGINLEELKEKVWGGGIRMIVDIKFKEDSPFKPGETEHLENVVEVHFNYNNEGRIAFEQEDTGCTYPISFIKEFEVVK